MFFRRTTLCLLLLTAMTAARAQMQYYYWFDSGEIHSVTRSATGTWNVDASELREGFHTLHVMACQEGKNNWSAPRTIFFVKAPALADLQGMTYVASVDDKVVQTGTVDSSGGNIVLDVNLDEVPTGFHCLHVALITKNGAATDVRNAYFWKLKENNHIVRYEYWIDDGTFCHETVDVTETDNPFILNKDLDIGETTFYSRNFAFVVAGGKAYAWAKHRLTVRFYDKEYQSEEVSQDFIDYRVGGQILGNLPGQLSFQTIVPGESQTVSEPTENGIHWFHFYAEEGDSLTLTTNRACMVDVFSPSGQTVYSTEDATVTDGFHAPVSGTYYVALHDVAQSSGANIQLTVTHVPDPAIPTAVTNVSTDDNDGTVYDLQGRKLPTEPDKGVYIKQRRKVMRK